MRPPRFLDRHQPVAAACVAWSPRATGLRGRDSHDTIQPAMNALRDLPLITDQSAFNLDRWDELCADPLWIEVEGKIETDRYGQVLVNPPTEYSHGGKQFDLGTLIARHAPPE